MTPSSSTKAGSAPGNAVGIKETLTSLIIAFMLAFLFRGFVIEGFQIPTGSMAPTLLGKHIRFTNPGNGYDWSVGPWSYTGSNGQGQPLRNQVDIEVHDPMTGMALNQASRRLAAGDRVFVLKYLPFLHAPSRWDVVVFKFPGSHENYIKRLVGLPGEQVAFVDGDVFARPFVEGQTARSGWGSWEASDWRVQRKSERVQRSMFQDVFDSRYAPSPPDPGYSSPFTGATPGWEGVTSGSSYRYTGSGATSLDWNMKREITDANAYNQTARWYNFFERSDNPGRRLRPFPDADVALRLDIEPGDAPVRVSPVLEARGMGFRAVVDPQAGEARVEMRPGDGDEAGWVTLDSAAAGALGAGEMHEIEFWHVDQALWLFLDGELVCGGAEKGAYELTPAQREAAATGLAWGELEDRSGAGDGAERPGIFSNTEIFRKPRFRWEFAGGPFTLHHVSVQRDIYYQVNVAAPTRGAHPDFFPTMSSEEYFMCGDNSERSADSRLWEPGEINPWVRAKIDDQPGMVNKDLIVGKAFVVYFPAPLDDGPILTPDVGRVRWIW